MNLDSVARARRHIEYAVPRAQAVLDTFLLAMGRSVDTVPRAQAMMDAFLLAMGRDADTEVRAGWEENTALPHTDDTVGTRGKEEDTVATRARNIAEAVGTSARVGTRTRRWTCGWLDVRPPKYAPESNTLAVLLFGRPHKYATERNTFAVLRRTPPEFSVESTSLAVLRTRPRGR